MAKRKKSKRHPPSEAATGAQLPTPAESPALVEAEPPTAPEAAPADAFEQAPEGVTSEPVESVSETPPDASTDPWPIGEAAPDPSAEPWAWPEGSLERDPAVEPGEAEPVPEAARLVSIIESLLFASDKPLGLAELKRLLGERDGKKITAAVEALTEQRKGTGIEVTGLSSGWLLRTNPENAAWVSKLLVGRPIRLSRAMLETLSIVAYRQPVTRPEIDDIRGVDCGPVLKTLLDRGLVRIIGKSEEVGRPILYGTTPEFLRIFNLRGLNELPALREFYDLTAEDQSRVEAEHGAAAEPPPSATSPKPDVALSAVARSALPPEPDETDPLLDELDEASRMAKKALGDVEPPASESAAQEDHKDATKTGDEPGPVEDAAPHAPPTGE